MYYNTKSSLKTLVAILLVFAMVMSLTGCAFTKNYKSKETGEPISTHLTKAFQLGISARMTYDILKLWKPDLCGTSILTDEQCRVYDILLYKMNGSLTLYSKATAYWYDLEIKPDSEIKMDLQSAIALMGQLMKDKDDFVNGIENLTGKKLVMPPLPDFLQFLDYTGK